MHVDAHFQASQLGLDAFIALPRIGGGLLLGFVSFNRSMYSVVRLRDSRRPDHLMSF
jgi:hypothetical protein